MPIASLIPVLDLAETVEGIILEGGFTNADETPSGDIDGSNPTFALSAVPVSAPDVLLFCNGVLQKQGQDYTIINAVITFETGSIPTSGSRLTAFYNA